MQKENKSVENILTNPRRAMLVMSIPLMLSMAVGELQTVLDTFWCSSLSSDQLSAIAICRPIYGLTMSAGAGMAVGASAAIAKALGARNRELADGLLAQTIVLILIASVMASSIMFFLRDPLIDFIGGGDNYDLCMSYMMPYVLLTFPIMMHNVFAGLLRAEGASKRAMELSLLATVFNMILDPVFIFGFDMGVTGASTATALSFLLTALIGFWLYLSGRTYVHLKFKGPIFYRPYLSEIAIIGVPCVLEMTLSPILMIPQNALVVACGGTDGLVVYINAFNLLGLAMIPIMAFANSVIPVISAELGEQRPDKIAECCRFTYKLNVTLALIGVFIFLIFADPICSIYANSDSMVALHPMFVEALRIYVFSLFFNTVYKTGNPIIRALRYAKISTALTFLRELIFIGTFVVASSISMTAIFWAVNVTNGTMMVICLIILHHVFGRYGIKFFDRDGSKTSC